MNFYYKVCFIFPKIIGATKKILFQYIANSKNIVRLLQNKLSHIYYHRSIYEIIL